MCCVTVVLGVAAACERSIDTVGAYTEPAARGGTGGAGGTGGTGGDGFQPLDASLGGAPPVDAGPVIIPNLPPDFTGADVGGYMLGPAIDPNQIGSGGASSANDDGDDCGNILLGVVRDFKSSQDPGGHPDFESMLSTQSTPHLVGATLGADKKPVYASKCELGTPLDMMTCPNGPQTTTRANFDQWYRNTPGVNKPYILYFYFKPEDNGLFSFQSKAFFPLDNAGWGNTPGQNHNFHFTSELHTKFRYAGGETFKFSGDDDVWVFVNDKLAVDLGGIHQAQDGQVDLDAAATTLGIKKGVVYDLDLFQAERHTNSSDFRIDTDLAFVNCGFVAPEVVK